MSITGSAVEKFLSSSLRSDSAGCTYLCSGAESDVYRLSGTPARILRTGAKSEAYARDAVVKAIVPQDIPVPAVFEVGQIQGIPYCISEELPGIPFAEASTAEQVSTYGAVLALLERIHDAGEGHRGFGPLDEAGNGSVATWDAWMASRELHSVEGLGDSLRQEIIEKIAISAPRNLQMHALVHGDYGWSNTLVNEGRVTGIVDWSTAMYGDPLYDGGRMYFWSTWVLPCIQGLWDTYCQMHGHEDRFWDRIYANALRSALRDDANTQREHARGLLPWVRTRAEIVLEEWTRGQSNSSPRY